MKTKREAPKRGGSGDRRSRRDGAARKRTPATADAVSSRRTPKNSTREPRASRSGRSGPQTSPITRPVERPGRAKNTSQAKARAKARKAKAPKVIRPKLSERLAIRLASIDLRPRTLASKVPFVVLVIGSLAVGLGLTLWLSTDSAERSYGLSHARERTRLLQQQKEALERDVREAESAPALAEAARKLGMIPTRDTAHLVQDPGGSWVVIGNPKPADGVPPPPLNSKLPDEVPPAPPPPAAPPPEVSVRVAPGPNDPQPPGRTGPQQLLRGPDGSTTLGTTALPALPGLVGGQPVPGLAPVPGQPQTPTGSVPQVPLPAQAPAQLPVAPQPVLPPIVPQAPTVIAPQAPGNGEQFTPVIPTTPGAPR
ncbi:MAG: hypothetical protein JO236_07445 [Mycobacterium sp.]|uniref:hypothetical protein n=1 Tax=Mycobacterium sp. TaxID=1785 RepID=UPI001EBC5682|nr:hypothetical protein [Mycobacterium sp.]MBW0017362.1 hypothetical protein [Mycobacterium sp.]